MKRSLYLTVAAMTLLICSGCVKESIDGQTRVYTYELWVPLSILIGGIVAGVGGWSLRKTSSRFAWVLLIGGPIAAFLFAPSMFRDRAVASADSFSLRTGIWGMTAVHEVNYSELSRVRLTSEEVRGRRGSKRTNYYLICERKDGTSAKVPMNNDLAEAAALHVLERIDALGIPIVNET